MMSKLFKMYANLLIVIWTTHYTILMLVFLQVTRLRYGKFTQLMINLVKRCGPRIENWIWLKLWYGDLIWNMVTELFLNELHFFYFVMSLIKDCVLTAWCGVWCSHGSVCRCICSVHKLRVVVMTETTYSFPKQFGQLIRRDFLFCTTPLELF